MATASTNLSHFNPEDLPNAENFRIGIAVAEWNSEITEALYTGAVETLRACGVQSRHIIKHKVPGTLELTYVCKLMCERKDFDAVIAIGVVIQGETRHFDFVCQSVTHGITELNLRYNTPVIYCVLTDNNINQSMARAGGKHGNKGVEAAIAALKMGGLNRLVQP